MADLSVTKEKTPREPPKIAVLGQIKRCFQYIKQNSIAEIVSTMESFLVAETGFEPRDLRVMSPTSYQAAPLRDIKFVPLVPVTGVEPVRYFRITGF